MKKRKNKTASRGIYLWFVFVFAALFVSALKEEKNVPAIDSNNVNSSEKVEFHFLDVGQADCSLIKSGDEYMLIDAGNNGDSEYILEYLQELRVEKLAYAIGTHPHEDHIGSFDDVINAFDVQTIIMPKFSATTKTFTDVLDAVESKNLKVTTPVPGDVYEFGSAKFQILAPVGSYDDANNNSVVLRFVHGDVEVLYMGDAETKAEEDILNAGFELSADVIKIGHHGSDTSSSALFLNEVKPTVAIISVGEGNKYGHPSKAVLQTLGAYNVALYRTDFESTIVVESDGENYEVYY